MIKKDKMPVTIGVAFVWFTTQFGGGFASGNQLRTYFINFGIWAFFTCVLTQLIGAFYQWYALKYAKKHELYDYRSFNDSFYRFNDVFGKEVSDILQFIFSNLYELVYIATICVAPAAAFATGVGTMKSAFGLNYWIGTVFTGLFIFTVAVYGTNVVRKVASTLSVLIVAGLIIVYIPNIIVQWNDIIKNISSDATSPSPVGISVLSGVVYAAFQLGAIGLLVQHAGAFKDENDAKVSMKQGFAVNTVVCLMAVLGLMAIRNDPSFPNADVPLLILVNRGVATAFLRPVISILIVLGSISTAVNMIAGMSNRVCVSIDKNYKPDGKPGIKMIAVTFVFTLLAFAIAQFGLNKIVAVGYKYLGYLTIPVIMIPYVLHMILTGFDKQ